MSSTQIESQATKKAKRKSRKRTKAQVEADRRLASLRKNLAREIELDFDRFSGSSPSAAAGLFALTRLRIILAFLQAFFPMFISAPKPRKVKRSVKTQRTTRARKSASKTSPKRPRSRRKVGIKVVRLETAAPDEPVIVAPSGLPNAEHTRAVAVGGEKPRGLKEFRVGAQSEVFVSSPGAISRASKDEDSVPGGGGAEAVADHVDVDKPLVVKPQRKRRAESKASAGRDLVSAAGTLR